MCKYIFVTGGVVSGLGKGITAASLGRLLKSRGLKVSAMKLDPYINVDPGTMSPYQHGEVFVTEDGSETDLDLGHYERFIDEDLNQYSNITTGKVYWNVLKKEREGKYLGETVQVIPHITNEIKEHIYQAQKTSEADVLICEVGGTSGDIESQPFLEAIRQVALEKGRKNCIYMHVTLIPFLEGSREPKSKPTQHSVKELHSYGIFPNILIARCHQEMDDQIKEKISLFCDIPTRCVIENKTLPSLYEVPRMLQEQGLDDIICEHFGFDVPKADLSSWLPSYDNTNHHSEVTIALIGKYIKLHDAYLSIIEALYHGAMAQHVQVNIQLIDSETITEDTVQKLLSNVQGVLIPGGFGNRGIEGKILAATYAREHQIPYLGICLGMQIAAIAFARSVLQYEDANSMEFHQQTKHPIIHLMNSQHEHTEKGGTMRLGAYPMHIEKDSCLYACYNVDQIKERHRHRYEFNNQYRDIFEKHGMMISGTSIDHLLVEAIEYPANDFYIGVQYHPEFKSRPNNPHPLFVNLIKYAKQYKK